MRYTLKLEAIGDNHTAYMRHISRAQRAGLPLPYNAPHKLLQAYQLGHSKSWVARITGLDRRFGLAREFIYAQKDYTHANGTGSRGIYLYYFLPPGLYEISERVTWKRTRRYFARVVDDHTIIELTREEAVQWLQQHTGAT